VDIERQKAYLGEWPRAHQVLLGRLIREIPPMATKRGGKRKKSLGGASKEKALIEALSASFSREEIQQILTCSLLSLDPSGIERLGARLGPETAATLRRVLSAESETAKATGPQPSIDKIRQEWDSAWEEWDACVAETGDEDGKYVLQEHHWEPPYLDKSALAEDLEPIAARMRVLLPRVYEGNLAPDFSFAHTLKNTVEDVGGVSEWIEDSGEGIAFGPEVTRCLLEWEWRAARRDNLGAFEFADGICRLEQSCEDMALDHSTVSSFVFDLEAEAQKEILEGIVRHRKSGHWARALESVHGGWFKLYQELCGRWDPPRYLETCRKGVSQNWKLALPVIEDLIARKAFQDALVLIEEALRAMLRAREGEHWDPRGELLIRHRSLSLEGEKDPAVISLLSHWLKLAQAVGNEEQVCALKLQLVVLRRWTNGDAILEALRRVPSPRFDHIRERLYQEWRSLIAERSVEPPLEDAAGRESAWVRGLVDAARAGADGSELLRRVILRWLEEIGKTRESLQQGLGGLAVLTLDLDFDLQLKSNSPVLKRLLSGHEVGDRRVAETRRGWLRHLDASALFPELMEIWKRNAARLVPEPEHSVGDYDDCAEWLAVVRDLDASSCERILQEWKPKHRRRRNLWKALERAKVPLGSLG
jgi:hypothetical protein